MYAIMGGFQMKQVVGYREKEVKKLNEKLRFWILRREKNDCLDLPPKLYSRREVPLSSKTWAAYKQMRDNMVVWADGAEQPSSVAAHGAVKAMRLAQLCTGFLGGILDDEGRLEEDAQELGCEKLQAFLAWQTEHPERMIVWCRFRAQLRRLVQELTGRRNVFVVAGGQSAKARAEQIKLFDSTPGSILVGNPQAGGKGLNLQAARHGGLSLERLQFGHAAPERGPRP